MNQQIYINTEVAFDMNWQIVLEWGKVVQSFTVRIWKTVVFFLLKVPFVSIFFTINKKAQLEAAVEMFVTLIFSTLPIWFGSAILTINKYFEVTKNKSTFNFVEAYCSFIVASVSNGELLMYAAATLGPTLYLGLSSLGKQEKTFPWVRPQLVTAVIINFFATVLFFMSRDKGYASNATFVFFTAVPYLISLLILFPAMAFDHERREIDPAKIQQDEQDDFINGYSRRRG